MNKLQTSLLVILTGFQSYLPLYPQSIDINNTSNLPSVVFAENEIRKEAGHLGLKIIDTDEPIPGDHISITLSIVDAEMEDQAYRIRVDRQTGSHIIRVEASQHVGLMYGGLDIAEAIRTGQITSLGDSDHHPHIEYRGIKFNIPLDLRTPTYTQISDVAQANIPEVWSMDFWRDMLNDMALHRYNVLSLWSLHPFPSIVKVPEYPNVALDDVWRTKEVFDDSFGGSGEDFVRPSMLANHEVIKKISIEEKIEFWQEVMELAHNRGIDIYWFTWNVFMHGAAGKDGITNKPADPHTIAYFRASVREMVKTYPLLAGIGITAGEGMPDREFEKISREEWLWQTYGEGIRDGLKDTPDRNFRLIHRFHLTGLSDITEAFAELPCELDLSFKYAIAHMYSVPDPAMIKPVLPLLNPELRSWLTVRNDDIYSFRWADPSFARDFIRAIPGPDKVVGFYMGCDNYIWGRDFLSRDEGIPRQTVMQKQWLSFSLWGRLAYDPDLPDASFKRLTSARFPGADVDELTRAWANASRTFPYITRFYWGDVDVKWFPEACWSHPVWYKGFHTLRDFVEGGTMPGANVLNIMEWRKGILEHAMPGGVTPPEIAAQLFTHASHALEALPRLRKAEITSPDGGKEYLATLGDIKAMAQLGLYYSAKISGACAIAIYDKTGEESRKTEAGHYMEKALVHWKDYASSYTDQYVQPVYYNRSTWVDIPGFTKYVEADLRLARDWVAGTIDEVKIRRSNTEAGFAK